jgi:hypothetical protein
VADNVTKVKDMWDLQKQLDEDRKNLESCLSSEPDEGCMTAGDYQLFSYYWLFRLETVIITISMCTILLFIALKFLFKHIMGTQSLSFCT